MERIKQDFEWRPLVPVEWEKFARNRQQFHRAIQNVAAVGRRFLPPSSHDHFAALSWVPGLSRLAGHWVKGDITFRSSLSFEHKTIYLVDERVNSLGEINLEGQTPLQLMIWLEEHIGKYGLDASNLAMNFPYEFPEYQKNIAEPFAFEDLEYCEQLARYYHNAFSTIRQIKLEIKDQREILIWPHHFDLAMDLIVKDSGDHETTSKISFGMSPGDENFAVPYFYVSCMPYVDIEKCDLLSTGFWVSENWTGALLSAKDLVGENQQRVLEQFYREASAQLIKLLLH